MAHAQQAVTVDRPIADVFAFLADGTNNQKWRPEVSDIHLVSGSELGALYAQSMKGPGGRTIQGDYRVTRFDRPTRIDFEVVAGPARPVGSFELRELSGSSTEVTFTLDVKPRGLMVVMAPMINKQVASEVANILNLPASMAD